MSFPHFYCLFIHSSVRFWDKLVNFPVIFICGIFHLGNHEYGYNTVQLSNCWLSILPHGHILFVQLNIPSASKIVCSWSNTKRRKIYGTLDLSNSICHPGSWITGSRPKRTERLAKILLDPSYSLKQWSISQRFSFFYYKTWLSDIVHYRRI